MSGAAGARPLALAAIAFVAAVAALATEHRIDPPVTRPAVLVPLDGAWEEARGAPLVAATGVTGCALVVRADTLAVTHPTLPCGLRVVIEVDDAVAAVQVAGRSPVAPGAAFGLTPALARQLRVTAPHALRWTLAAGS